MKVIVRLGNGKYYLSKVFGIFKNNFMGSKAKYYYIIFDENMKTLIPKFEYKQNTDYIIPEILIYDNDTSDMKINENHCGQVNFLSDDEMKNILDGKVNDTILEKCMKYVDNNKIDYIEIKNDKDIQNFMLVSGYLHDGYIKKIFKNKNLLHLMVYGVVKLKWYLKVIFNIKIKEKKMIYGGAVHLWFSMLMKLF